MAAAGDADLGTRLQALEDRLAIQDLVAEYARAVDDRDMDLLRGLYATDAVFDSPGGRSEGAAAVVAYYAQRTRLFTTSFHVPHTLTVDFVGPDEATGVVTAHAEMAMPDGAFWVALRYLDRYVREDGAWRFAERQVRQLYALPLRDLPELMGAEHRVRWPGTEPATAPLPDDLPSWKAWISG